MFSKIDKKVLIVSAVALVIILLAGFFVFRYLNQIKATETQNSLGGASIDNSAEQKNNSAQQTSPVDIGAGGVEVNGGSGGNGGDGFTVCADRCGDGICQKPDPSCKGKLNCTCPETPQDCPQDCK